MKGERNMDKILIGISGGIDSAVTAAIFKELGFDVTGMHIHLSERSTESTDKLNKLSEVLAIDIIESNLQEKFKNTVIKYFRSEHLKGHSPSPCAICNPAFKWKELIAMANKIGIEKVGTGHYIQKTQKDGLWWIEKGTDELKDQSYFLWGLGQDMLERIITPLGKITKKQTRELAEKHKLGFLQAQKESTGLCFAGKLSYHELLNKHIPELKNIGPGKIIDTQGKIIGTHKGFAYYTIGQKKGLELNATDSLCVIEIDAKNNQLVVGNPMHLWKKSFKVRDFKFHSFDKALDAKQLEVKIRGFGWNPKGYASISRLNRDELLVELENPAWAVAPGQPAVFYENGLLLGGGIVFS